MQNTTKPQEEIPSVDGLRAEGRAFVGCSAVVSTDLGTVALFAPDETTLEIYWNQLVPLPLDHAGVQDVVLFAVADAELPDPSRHQTAKVKEAVRMAEAALERGDYEEAAAQAQIAGRAARLRARMADKQGN